MKSRTDDFCPLHVAVFGGTMTEVSNGTVRFRRTTVDASAVGIVGQCNGCSDGNYASSSSAL